MEIDEVENTVKRLCAAASAQRNHPREVKNVMIQLREFLHEHIELMKSMSAGTFEMLRKVWQL